LDITGMAASRYILFWSVAPLLWAQTGEITSKEAPVTFKSTSNLVSVPVVVRDGKGHAVGDLGRDDFQLFDEGKPQVISRLTLEKIEKDAPVSAGQAKQKTDQPAVSGAITKAEPDGIPDRFVAYLFDDLHTGFSDLVATRDAAKRQIDASPHLSDRVAIYTTSGRQMQDFTGDVDKLHATLGAIGAGTAGATRAMQMNSCPTMTYYMADQIVNRNDQTSWIVAMDDVIVCASLQPQDYPTCTVAPGGTFPPACQSVDLTRSDLAQTMVKQAAQVQVNMSDRDTERTFDAFRTVIRKMASMPGQRSIVLVSPGFLVASDRLEEETALIERAIKASVVIGALDARGLYTEIPGGDASTKSGNINAVTAKSALTRAENLEQANIMSELAAGTGGTFYKGTNDMDEGFVRTAAVPEYIYVLGFTPLSLKLDGAYHTLKVTLKNAKGMNLQVRKGYYAAKYSADPKEQVKQQMEETFFSRDEIHDLPAELQTQYFKLDNGDATLSAMAMIDVKKLTFQKEGDRNLNEVTVQTGLFDSDGNFVTGLEKVVTLRLLDETLEKRLGSGIGVKCSFTVHPGWYVVRMVVRDTQGQLMAAQSSLVEIQ
jgi:VWFA-related protein